MVSISTLLMRLGAPSFSIELAQHIRLCGRDKDAISHAKMILGVAEEQAFVKVVVIEAFEEIEEEERRRRSRRTVIAMVVPF